MADRRRKPGADLGSSARGFAVQFSADGGSVYAYRPFGNMNEVWLVELGSGKRRLWKKIQPADPRADMTALRLTPDGESYVYGLYRPLSTA